MSVTKIVSGNDYKQWSIVTTSDRFGNYSSIESKINTPVDSDNPVDETIPPKENFISNTAFGEVNVAINLPYIQSAPLYNFTPSNFRNYTYNGGIATVENRMFKAATGTNPYGYGAVQSFRAINYKAGEGGMARFTALFESAAENSWQGCGLISISDEFSFGFNGLDFGIWHRYGGIAEVRTITVTGAAGGSENLTLTLNSVPYTIPLTSGTDDHNASEIATWLNSNQTVWGADQVDNTVIINALSDAPKSGTYSYNSSTSTGTIAQNVAGVTKISNFIPQTSWNGTRAYKLNPNKGNVYQILYQYLGFGNVYFYREDVSTGRFTLVHTLHYANENTAPSITNPSLRLGLYAVSLGSTDNLVVRSASMAGFTQGVREKTRNPRGYQNTQTVSTSFTNILTIRNRRTYNYYTNQVEIEPLFLTVSNESSKNVEVEIRAAIDTGQISNYTSIGTDLITDVDTSAVTVTAGNLLAVFTVAGLSGEKIDLRPFAIRLPPTLNLVVQARVTSGASASVSAALTWYEDV